MTGAAIMLIALALDYFLGWPKEIHEKIGHPVEWAGKAISFFDETLNKPSRPHTTRLLAGVVTLIALCLAVIVPTLVIEWILPSNLFGILVAGILSWPLIAMRSLIQHVDEVRVPLEAGDLDAARVEVAKIVGRNPDQLDQPALTRATIESLAENSSDGIIAPIFWGLFFGLPGLAVYKMVNTLDSMIGHQNERYSQFGFASARIDDVLNWVPARLSAGLLMVASGKPVEVWEVVRENADNHRSPNAGWPESAVAGAMNIRLSGPRSYGEGLSADPWINFRAPDPKPDQIGKAISLVSRACFLLALILLLLALI